MEALLAYLPFVLVMLLCPLLMLFMHGRGHEGTHQHDDSAVQPRASARLPGDETPP